MNFLLDTTVLIDVLRGKSKQKHILKQLIARGDRLATTTLNLGEVYGGLRPIEEAAAETFLLALEIYPLTAELARRAGRLQYEWARRGKTLELPDMIVAATALEYGLVLVTENRRDFPMPELKMFDASTDGIR
jgi:predicted nucleic acid-binding protein